MKKTVLALLLAFLAAVAVGCGDSDDDVTFNGNQNNSGNVGTAFLRMTHLVPAGQNYDVYVNNELVLNNLTFGQFTDYLAVAGNAELEVTQAGNRNIVFVTRTLSRAANTYATLALTGDPVDVEDVLYPDSIAEFPNLASIRVINASEDNLTVTLTQSSGAAVVGPVVYPNESNYAEVTPGTYDLQIRDSNNIVVAQLPGVILDAGVNFSAYFYGTSGTSTQELVVVADLTTQGQPASF